MLIYIHILHIYIRIAKTHVILIYRKGINQMGSAIIDAIKSGLGLIADLCEEFLTGFSTLFWDATANNGAGALTTFGLFSMVFLGIAITMSVVKLCLSVIRGNTGV